MSLETVLKSLKGKVSKLNGFQHSVEHKIGGISIDNASELKLSSTNAASLGIPAQFLKSSSSTFIMDAKRSTKLPTREQVRFLQIVCVSEGVLTMM